MALGYPSCGWQALLSRPDLALGTTIIWIHAPVTPLCSLWREVDCKEGNDPGPHKANQPCLMLFKPLPTSLILPSLNILLFLVDGSIHIY